MHVSTQRCSVPGQEQHPAIAVGRDEDTLASWRWRGLPSKPHAKGIREGCAQELVSGGSEADGTPQGPCMPMQLASYGFGHAVTTDGGNGSTAFFAYVLPFLRQCPPAEHWPAHHVQ